MDFVQQVKDMAEMVRNLPPMPRIVAVHSVPFGRVLRQWDTDGELWVWVNRGELMEIPPSRSDEFERIFSGMPLFGIPIYYDHPYWRKREVQGPAKA